MSPLALVFPKHKMFDLGARPVIYGLDDPNASLPTGKGGGPRLIDPTLLPPQEQHRYVTFNPTGSYAIDWTHEREWRWPYRGDLAVVEAELAEFGIVSDAAKMPGLDLSNLSLQGMGVLVESHSEATQVVHDILSLVDRNVASKTQFEFVLKGKELIDREALHSPSEVEKAISDASVDLHPFFSMPMEKAVGLESDFRKLVVHVDSQFPCHEPGERGSVWLWLLDNTHPLTRGLLMVGRVIVTRDGRYLANLPEFSAARSLRQREKMVSALGNRIADEYNIECGYFTVLNSQDPSEVPFYCDDHLDNRMYYNVSWK